MKIRRLLPLLVLAIALCISSLSCSSIEEMSRALSNLARVKFKLDSISGFTLAGIPLSGKRAITVQDGLQLLPAFQDKRFPASFTLNIAAINPNDGSQGTQKADVRLTGLAWTLLIDSTTTITGDINDPVSIPGSGEQVIIPLNMGLDLYQFFQNRGYDGIINLALALGGINRSPSHVILRARPTIRTSLTAFTYPHDIDIRDKEFRSQ